MDSGPRNPFLAPHEPTFADAIKAIDEWTDWSVRERREVKSAFRTISEKWLKLPHEMVPADANTLRRKLNGMSPATVDCSKGTWANVISRAMKAIRRLSDSQDLRKSPLNRDYQGLYDSTDDPRRYALSRLFRLLSNTGVPLTAICDDHITALRDALEAETFVADPAEKARDAAYTWNRLREIVPGWPDVTLTVPVRQQTYCAKKEELTLELVDAIEQYIEHLEDPDPTDDRAPPNPFRPASLQSIRKNLMAYLGAARNNDVNIGSLQSLDAMVGRAVFRPAITWLRERASKKKTQYVTSIIWTVRNLAVKYLECDEDLEAYYARAYKKLRYVQTGLSEKNKKLLDALNENTVPRLVALPKRLRDEVGSPRSKQNQRQKAYVMEIALAIELLLVAPMRLQNLATLDIERHFNWQQDRDGQRIHIHIEAAEVKNSYRLHYPLPASVSQNVRTFIQEWRPTLVVPGTRPTSLFVGRTNAPKDKSSLGKRIGSTMLERVGLRITPHQMRHVTAKIYLDRHPGGYAVVQRALGHKTLETLMTYYSGCETKSAIEHFDEAVLEAGGEDLDRESWAANLKPRFTPRRSKTAPRGA